MSEDTKPKKRTNSKAKGSGFENSIVKVLGTALAPMKFKRTQSSGAILGGKNVKDTANFSNELRILFTGDLAPTNELDVQRAEGWTFRFTVECKFYKDADRIDHLLGKTQIRRWFQQAQTDADKVERLPLLIFKFNFVDPMIATTAPLPLTCVNQLTMTFGKQGEGKESDLPPVTIHVGRLADAIQDLAWWKDQH